MDKIFKTFLVREKSNGEFVQDIIMTNNIKDLTGDTVIEVEYSSLNYKDALSATGNKGVTKNYPHTPGIDAAGKIVECSNKDFNIGDRVVVTGYDLGMNTPGGFAKYIRVPSSWVIKLPESMTARESMMYGTAGITAGLSIEKIVNNIKPADGNIVVTGATGGVGSLSIEILLKLGYKVIAITTKESEIDLLINKGVSKVILKDELLAYKDKPMTKPMWQGGIDTVGGDMLPYILKSTGYNGVVTCCGNVGGNDFNVSVFPFILRGITLYGIDSVQCVLDKKAEIWKMLASDWNIANLKDQVEQIYLGSLTNSIKTILKGKHKGRTIVRID